MKLSISTKPAHISLLVAMGVALTATSASARQFTKLLEVGQKVPGSDQPVAAIVEPTIGLDGQVAVLLKTNPTTQGTTLTAFQGIYSWPKNGTIRFLEGGAETTTGLGTPTSTKTAQVFSAPSISGGAIAYLRMSQTSQGSGATPRSTSLRVGTPGNIKTVLNFQLSLTPPQPGKPNLAFVNGKAYFLDDLLSANGTVQMGVLGLIETQSATPSLKILNQDAKNRGLAVSSNAIVLAKTDSPTGVKIASFWDSSGDSNFKQILIPRFSNVFCSGFSASQENVAICDGTNPRAINVRFGRQSQVFSLPIGSPTTNPLVFENPSISGRSVLYVRTEQIDRAAIGNARLELSQNGQAPITVLKAGDTLDGKVVRSVGLSQNGRSLAGNAAVISVYFSRGEQILYRVDL
jgi:hypothetical protein